MKLTEAIELLLEMVKQEKDGLWYVYSEKTGKRLSKGYSTEKEAKNRLRQIEYFKLRGQGKIPPPKYPRK